MFAPLPLGLLPAAELALLVGWRTEPPHAGGPAGGVGAGKAGFIAMLLEALVAGVVELQFDPDAGGRLML